MKRKFLEPEIEIIELMKAGIIMDNVENSNPAFGDETEGEQGSTEV